MAPFSPMWAPGPISTFCVWFAWGSASYIAPWWKQILTHHWRWKSGDFGGLFGLSWIHSTRRASSTSFPGTLWSTSPKTCFQNLRLFAGVVLWSWASLGQVLVWFTLPYCQVSAQTQPTRAGQEMSSLHQSWRSGEVRGGHRAAHTTVSHEARRALTCPQAAPTPSASSLPGTPYPM